MSTTITSVRIPAGVDARNQRNIDRAWRCVKRLRAVHSAIAKRAAKVGGFALASAEQECARMLKTAEEHANAATWEWGELSGGAAQHEWFAAEIHGCADGAHTCLNFAVGLVSELRSTHLWARWPN